MLSFKERFVARAGRPERLKGRGKNLTILGYGRSFDDVSYDIRYEEEYL